MISIIVCSIRPDLLKRLEENISVTIGLPYEVLVFDNRTAGKGICEVYNLLALKARFDTLCFLHEDIEFQSKNWGTSLNDFFLNNSTFGVAGIAGSAYKSASYSGWYTGNKMLDVYHVIHQFPNKREEQKNLQDESKNFYPVVCIDGVFIGARKNVWNSIRFNEEKLKGFHFYDIDFSLRSSLAGISVAVLSGIKLTHYTQEGGDYGNSWVREAFVFHNYSWNYLPYSIQTSPSEKLEREIAICWLDMLKSRDISLRNKIRWVKEQRLHALPSAWYNLAKFFLYHPLNLKLVHKMIRKLKK